MSIVTQSVPFFPIPSACPYCDNKHAKLYKHGERERHVIKQGEKIWGTVKRLCCSVCKCTCTLLRLNMLPHKHYAAPEIEQVLQKQEKPTDPAHECGAEESTIYRWKCEFPSVLTAMFLRLSSLVKAAINLISVAPPLQRLYDTLSFLGPPLGSSRLAWAFFLDKFHPVCL